MDGLIDAHHHFWDTSRPDRDYYWMSDGVAALRGRFGPPDLRPSLLEHGVKQTILIQTIPSLAETRDFLRIAADTDFVAGVVGWVDLHDPQLRDTLAELRTEPGGDRLVGIRHQVHDEPDHEWLLRPAVQRGIGQVVAAGLVYDLLVRPRELNAALRTVKAFPNGSFVIDHIGKPAIREGSVEPWASGMHALAAFPGVSVKVSGMITEADWAQWQSEELVPYVRRVLDWFGPERLMFGSDWPVCTLAGSYAQVIEAARFALGDLSAQDQASVFRETAARVYQLSQL